MFVSKLVETPYKFPPFKCVILTFLENTHGPIITPPPSTLKESTTSNKIIPILSSPSNASAKNPDASIAFSLLSSLALKMEVTIP